MLQFLGAHIHLVNAFLNALLVIVWVAYLQVFLVNHLRQSRSIIHIDIGAAQGARIRCLVTNLGSNPVYVQGIVADFFDQDHSARTVITDRDEIAEDDVEDPLSRTNRGTLLPGQTVDIGSLADMVDRARIRLEQEWSVEEMHHVTVTVIAVSGHVDRLVGASKTFDARFLNGRVNFVAQRILTQQIRPRHARAAFSPLLRDQPRQ